MRGYFCSLVLIFTFVVACNRNDKQPRILSREEMEEITWDIMLVDEKANDFFRDSTIKNPTDERMKLYLKVFQLHQVSRADYNASIKFYAAKPDVMKRIFDSLSVKGERVRMQADTLKQPKEVKKAVFKKLK